MGARSALGRGNESFLEVRIRTMTVFTECSFDRSSPPTDRNMIHPNQALQASLEQALRGFTQEASSDADMQELCSLLSELQVTSNKEEWDAVKATCRAHPLFDIIQEDPLSRRIYEKPRGYAGDARMMDLIYKSEQPRGLNDVGQRVYDFVTDRQCAHGARARKMKLAALLNKTMDEYDAPEILSVACGHMREAQLLSTNRLNRARRIVAFDQDETSLAEVSRSLGDCEALSLVSGSVRRLIAGRHNLGTFDLIYSLGLYDYLEQPIAQRLTQVLFDALNPGGRLVIANYLPNESSGFMEAFLEWELIYRSKQEIMDMAGGINDGAISSKSYSEEHTGTIGFLELTKLPARAVAV